MRRLAVISLHTSPLAQPGTGDGGGMNVYVRELSTALAQAGVDCDVFTRSWRAGLPATVEVDNGVRVHHIAAGPLAETAKNRLPEVVDEFTAGMLERLHDLPMPDLIHANYWLSGIAGHALKHAVGLPLVSTFHTLARVKADGEASDHRQRARFEAEIVGCSDAILTSCSDEAAQLEHLYAAVPGRVEVVPPGVDHRLFSPGDRGRARQRLRLGGSPVLLFVGRIQPLKGASVAVRALAALSTPDATLLVVGGPSGPAGEAEMARLAELVRGNGLCDRVRFVPPQPHRLLADYYRAADVCLVPSRSESFGLVALEAAACGTPVVAAAVGGLRTLVAHARSGFLVEGRDPLTYAAYVEEILANGILAAEMSGNAVALARRYRWSITAARLRRLYVDLTARQRVECGS